MNSATFCLFVMVFNVLRGTSTYDVLSQEDKAFCKGGLELRYPDLDINDCMVVPKEFRERISRDWGAPEVQLASADQKKTYVLMMVDPDVPSRTSPTRSYWRHWLMVDVKGSGLRVGDVEGTVLSEYAGPSPPKGSGFHRYQFLLYEQATGQALSLSEQEESSRGNWDPKEFVKKFSLRDPVASLQFCTQQYKD
ncbi:phosphatidylethanolamine-binding protein 4 [Brachyhypopomus gauderio]|uniref:phosphatidylethanolamine-binding protein 4 n=1 Tax=Brachyhypopomus gauderio TaxID=698409 RepID=UPI004042F5E4